MRLDKQYSWLLLHREPLEWQAWELPPDGSMRQPGSCQGAFLINPKNAWDPALQEHGCTISQGPLRLDCIPFLNQVKMLLLLTQL